LLQPPQKNDKNYEKEFKKNIFQPTYENTRKNKAKKYIYYIYSNVRKTKNKATKKITFLLCFKWVKIYCIYDFFFFFFFALFFLVFS
jgi:hypothetical protein